MDRVNSQICNMNVRVLLNECKNEPKTCFSTVKPTVINHRLVIVQKNYVSESVNVNHVRGGNRKYSPVIWG